jgi:hypothetical protein
LNYRREKRPAKFAGFLSLSKFYLSFKKLLIDFLYPLYDNLEHHVMDGVKNGGSR